jgi:hypothetical protein
MGEVQLCSMTTMCPAGDRCLTVGPTGICEGMRDGGFPMRDAARD